MSSSPATAGTVFTNEYLFSGRLFVSGKTEAALPKAGALDLTALRRALELARSSREQLCDPAGAFAADADLDKGGDTGRHSGCLRELATGGNGLAAVVEACYVRWAELVPEKASAAALALAPEKV